MNSKLKQGDVGDYLYRSLDKVARMSYENTAPWTLEG